MYIIMQYIVYGEGLGYLNEDELDIKSGLRS